MAALLSIVIVLYTVMIAPVKIRFSLLWYGKADIDLHTRIWGLPLKQQLSMTPDELIHMLPDQKQAEDNAVRRELAALGTMLRTDFARHYLKRHMQIVQLDALIRLSMQDAARTAIVSGMLHWAAQAVYSLAKGRARIAVVPAFFAEHSSAEVRCILFFRLGHMIIVGMAALAAWMLERREHGLTHSSKEV